MSSLRLSDAAIRRISDAGARAVKERPAGTSELSAVVASAVGAATREILATVESEFKARRFMSFRGPHDPAQFYEAGAVVQQAGSAWVCMTATGEPPGGSRNWRKLGKE